MSKSENRTVWSSEQGDLRKQKQNLSGRESLSPWQQTAYLHRESSGRGGKAVTVVKVITQFIRVLLNYRTLYFAPWA